MSMAPQVIMFGKDNYCHLNHFIDTLAFTLPINTPIRSPDAYQGDQAIKRFIYVSAKRFVESRCGIIIIAWFSFEKVSQMPQSISRV